MWKTYRPSPIFDRELRPYLKLPEQTKGGLSTWFDENMSIKKRRKSKRPHHRMNLIQRNGSGRCSVGFTQCNGFELCVKEYVIPGFFGSKLLEHNSPLRRHNKLVIYKHHKRMFDLGISVPEPYACLYEHSNQERPATYIFISQKLEGAKHLGWFVKRWEEDTSTVEERKQVFSRAGYVIASMHKHRYLHNDLSLSNIMIKGNEVYLIDLNGAAHLPWILPIHHRINRELNRVLGILADNTKTERDMYILVSLFFAEYCKVFGVKPSRMLRDIRHGLANAKSNHIERKRKRKIRRLYKWVEYATGFCDNISVK